MSRHVIRAEVEVRFIPTGMTEHEYAYPTIDIAFEYAPGCRAQGPSYSSGGEPATGAEVDFVSAVLIRGDGLDPPQAQVNEWARTWIEDAGYEDACALAEDESGPDPDYEHERMRDDRGWP